MTKEVVLEAMKERRTSKVTFGPVKESGEEFIREELF